MAWDDISSTGIAMSAQRHHLTIARGGSLILGFRKVVSKSLLGMEGYNLCWHHITNYIIPSMVILTRRSIGGW
jgi:hypothetical protein